MEKVKISQSSLSQLDSQNLEKSYEYVSQANTGSPSENENSQNFATGGWGEMFFWYICTHKQYTHEQNCTKYCVEVLRGAR
jgi:hypothetical protein